MSNTSSTNAIAPVGTTVRKICYSWLLFMSFVVQITSRFTPEDLQTFSDTLTGLTSFLDKNQQFVNFQMDSRCYIAYLHVICASQDGGFLSLVEYQCHLEMSTDVCYTSYHHSSRLMELVFQNHLDKQCRENIKV